MTFGRQAMNLMKGGYLPIIGNFAGLN